MRKQGITRAKPILPRILYIDQMIRERRYPNAPLLAREYEIDQRTIERDIEYMRNQLGCPIAYDHKRRGYYYTEPTFSLPAITISESELFALCVAEKAMEHYRATPLYKPLAAAFEKILSVLPDEVSAGYSWLNPDVTFLDQSHTRILPGIWEEVSKAMFTSREITISYRKPGDNAGSRRTVRPYHMLSYGGEWYLVAHCCTRGEVRSFALSRMEEALVSQTPFEKPADFSIADYLGSQFGITREEGEHTVVVEFSGGAAPFIREREWQREQEVVELPGGGVRLRFATGSLVEVRRWILSWGGAAKVIEPESLVRDIASEVSAMRELYEKTNGK